MRPGFIIIFGFVLSCGGGADNSDLGQAEDLLSSALDAPKDLFIPLDSSSTPDPGLATDLEPVVDGGSALDPGLATDSGTSLDPGELTDPGMPIDPGSTLDTTSPGKLGGAPCNSNDECQSAACIPSNAGTVCAQLCSEGCDDDWPCVYSEEEMFGGEWVCLQDMLHICRPCIEDSDCTSFSGDPGARCNYFGPLFGSFCGADCSEDGLCPDGYECVSFTDEEDLSEHQQCTPISGQCPCGSLAVIDGAKTFCGTDICPGARKCEVSGLTDCDAQIPEDESCDGEDNDCDGAVDEDLGSLSCGLGICANEVLACVDAVSQECVPLDLSTDEVCDGLDNDCDGDVDNHLGHLVCGQGVCAEVVQACVDGISQECVPLNLSTDEACDGLDNDCDGATDEGLGSTSCGLGLCTNTVENCVSGAVVTCVPLDLSTDEACDGLDNDCDDEVDEGLVAPLGENQQGVCAGSVKHCVGDGGWQPPDLSSIVNYEFNESLCDGLDNDCNGMTDEQCIPLGELVSDSGFDELSGNICGVTGLSAGPQALGGGWHGYIYDTNPGNTWSCTNMCANADSSSGSGAEPAGFSGGPNGAGCVSWLYQCVTIPNAFNSITLSYRLKAYDVYSGMKHRLVISDQCFTEDLPPGNWSPDMGTIIFENSEEPFTWTDYSHDLTEALSVHTGQTLLIGIATENNWIATYNGFTWVDDVHMLAD